MKINHPSPIKLLRNPISPYEYFDSVPMMRGNAGEITLCRFMRKLVMITGFCCIYIIAGCNVKPVVRQISDTIQINKDWMEIRPTPPLEVSEQVQRISVEVADLPNWQIRSENNSFVTPDGITVKIDVELVASDGSRYMLESLGLGPGLTFSYLPQEPSATASRLPENMKFTSVRFRSDRPINGGRVTWICITNY